MAINDTLNKVQGALVKDMGTNNLQKALTTASNEVNYDLQAPAKDLFPVITPLRNRIPRVLGNGGTATHWKSIYGITASPGLWVPEGQRAGRQNTVAIDVAASYKTIGVEDNVTEEAINAAIGFEDVMARMTLRLLEGAMMKEEMAILFGNGSVSLGSTQGAIGTITTTNAAVSGATLPGSPTTYYAAVVALTGEGWINAGAISGAAGASTLSGATTVTGADGNTYTVNGGSSIASAQASQAITLGQGLGLSIPAIAGATAYAWFLGTTTGAANLKLEFITTANSILITTPLAGTSTVVASQFTTDTTTNSNYGFNGLFYSAVKSGSGAYYNSVAAGATLTAGGRRNISEIDVMLKSMWDNHRVSPSVMLVNSQEIQTITNKTMNNSSQPLLLPQGNDPYAVVAGGQVTGYYNPFTMGGSTVIPIMLHPYCPPGTIMTWTENLPAQYQNTNTPNVVEMHVRKEYVQTFWPRITRTRDVGVYVEETLAVYAPFAMGIITNLTAG
jgi:hypothetical protein